MSLQAALAAHHLTVLGGFHPTEEDGTPPGTEVFLAGDADVFSNID